MRNPKFGLVYKGIALILVLMLLVTVFVACDDDDDDETTQPAATQPTATQPADTGEKEPVKIGVIGEWTGPNAIAGLFFDKSLKALEYQVEQQGGILGGRPLELVKFDAEGSAAKAVAGWAKLVESDHVSAILLGGGSDPTITASGYTAADYKVPLFTVSLFPYPLPDYVIRAWYPGEDRSIRNTLKMIRGLEPKTVAFFIDEGEGFRKTVQYMKEQLEQDGVEVVSEQYIPLTTMDYSPYATRVFSKEPDVLVFWSSLANAVKGIFNSAMERGGWHDTKFFCMSSIAALSISDPAAEGTYGWSPWLPNDSTGSQIFERDFEIANGRAPIPSYDYAYAAGWACIKAMELAGSDDPEDIYQAAKSGNLKYEDSPSGLLTWDTDGEVDNDGFFYFVKDGKPEFIELP